MHDLDLGSNLIQFLRLELISFGWLLIFLLLTLLGILLLFGIFLFLCRLFGLLGLEHFQLLQLTIEPFIRFLDFIDDSSVVANPRESDLVDLTLNQTRVECQLALLVFMSILNQGLQDHWFKFLLLYLIAKVLRIILPQIPDIYQEDSLETVFKCIKSLK